MNFRRNHWTGLVILGGLIFVSRAHATLLISDNFNGGIGAWSTTSTGVNATVTNPSVESTFTNISGGDSAQIFDNSGSLAPAMFRNFTIPGGDASLPVVIEFDYLYTQKTTQPAFQLNDGVIANNGLKMHLTNAANNHPAWRDTVGFNSLTDTSLTAGNWYRFRLVVQPASTAPDKWALFITDTTGALDNSYANLTFQSELATFSRVTFFNNTGVAIVGGDFNIDNVRVETMAAASEINVRGGSPLAAVVDGSVSTSTTNGTDFGTVIVGASPVLKTFNIRNDGTGDLTFSGSSTVTGSAFSVSTQPAGPVAIAASTSLGVTLATAAPGSFAETVTVPNNDANEGTYDFNVSGIVLDHADAEFVSPSSTNTLNLNFGSIVQNTGTYSLQYQIQNLLASFRAGLDLDAINEISDPSSIFSTNASTFSNLANGATSNLFDVFLNSSTTLGAHTAQYTFNLSDQNGLAGSIGGQVLTLNVSAVVVPEPGTLTMLLFGSVVIWLMGGTRRRPC